MSLSLGIVGLPNVGKSTLFHALTKKKIEIANYPFCTIDPNVGVVLVPDARLDQLAKKEASEKIVPTTIEFVDIAGLVKGAHQGEGLGNQFLSHIREVDAIAMVLRCFEDENIIHVTGKVDPQADFETIALELVMADLANVEKRLERVAKEAKSGDKEKIMEQGLLAALRDRLQKGSFASGVETTEAGVVLLQSYQLLTSKPMLVIANQSDDVSKNLPNVEIRDLSGRPLPVIPVCAKLESELAELSEEEAKHFLSELGLKASGLEQLIQASYRLLDLITFITAGPKETKAWTVRRGAAGPEAAGKIHTDFERGFISAEVIGAEELLAIGSWQAAKAAGKLRREGKAYLVQDGDVVHFYFSV